jgi:hypothetical protein
MRSEAFEAQKTHLGCRYEQREYERGPHDRGAREQVGLPVDALRPVVQREWHSANEESPRKNKKCVLGRGFHYRPSSAARPPQNHGPASRLKPRERVRAPGCINR